MNVVRILGLDPGLRCTALGAHYHRGDALVGKLET
jgi:hypothetical protein